MDWHISRPLIERLIARAAETPDREICGLLFGRDGVIQAEAPAANVHPDPARAFELDPAALIAAMRADRAGAQRLIGHYHSHPGGRAEPSTCDAAAADTGGGALWLILAGGKAALFRAAADGPIHGSFTAQRLIVTS